MSLFRFLARMLGFGESESSITRSEPSSTTVSHSTASQATVGPLRRKTVGIREGQPLKRGLSKLRYESSLVKTPAAIEVVESNVEPYEFARFGPFRGTYLDLSQDADSGWLDEFNLPDLRTPRDLADYLEVPLGRLAWLANRCRSRGNVDALSRWHYTPKWLSKRRGGVRLIEIPKPQLRLVQDRILKRILNNVPPHRAAHGFVRGRSAITNADLHVGAGVIYKIDLEDFYGTIRLARVVSIFRTLGFSREVAMWLGHLTTSMPPRELQPPSYVKSQNVNWFTRHLPQGAPTSPALANLSAYSLDVRMTGLAKSYNAAYSRYADDLTFSGPRRLIKGLRQFIPLTDQIVQSERFRINKAKRRVLRGHQRMTVTGIVVNDHLNMSRADYDRLKAILHNCVKHGAASQNRDDHPDFEAHLRGRVEYASQLNPLRGAKLKAIYEQIIW